MAKESFAQKVAKSQVKGQSWVGSKEYKALTERTFASVQAQQLETSQLNAKTERVKTYGTIAGIFKPVIVGVLIILLLAGPGVMAVTNIVTNTSFLTWIGIIFAIVLVIKLGIFSRR